mgnify:CR=1 FL=1
MENVLIGALLGGGSILLIMVLQSLLGRMGRRAPAAAAPQARRPHPEDEEELAAARALPEGGLNEVDAETSAADMRPLELTESGTFSAIQREGKNRRLAIRIRPNLLRGSADEQRQAFIDIQKRWILEIVNELNADLHIRETDHFLLVSDAGKEFRDYFKGECELRYREQIAFFKLDLNPELWDGKLCVFLFLDDEQYQDFAHKLDGFTPRMTDTGYIRIDDRLAYVVLRRPFDALGASLAFVQHLCGVMCHYRAGGESLPRWIQEGLSIFLQTQTDIGAAYRESWHAIATKATSLMGEGINDLLSGAVWLSQERARQNDALAVSFALVELLAMASHEAFIKLLDRVRAGHSAEQAIRKLYGEKIQLIWEVWQSRNVGSRMKKQVDDSVRKAFDQLRSLADPEFDIPGTESQVRLVRGLAEGRPELSASDLKPLQESGSAPPLEASGSQTIDRTEAEEVRKKLGLPKSRKPEGRG